MGGFIAEECSGWRPAEVAWGVFCVASIAGLSILWKEPPLMIFAAVCGMMYTLLAGKGKSCCYLFGLINTPLYMYAAWQQRYYGDVALNAFYFLMMLPGFIVWRKHRRRNAEKGVEKTVLTKSERWVWLAVMVAATVVLYRVLVALGGARAWCDAMTNVLSVGAMILTVKRCAEQWPLWIAVNLIEVFMWFGVSGAVSLLLMWILFLVNGCVLGFAWYRELAENRP